MTKYLYRTCPKCKDYLGVVVRDPPGPKGEIPIDTYCCRCGFKLLGKVVLSNLGNKGFEREATEHGKRALIQGRRRNLVYTVMKPRGSLD